MTVTLKNQAEPLPGALSSSHEGRGHPASENFLATSCSTLKPQPGQTEQQPLQRDRRLTGRCPALGGSHSQGMREGPPIPGNPDQPGACPGLTPEAEDYSDVGFQ